LFSIKRTYKRLFIWIVFLSAINRSIAQQPYALLLNKASGLPNNSVYQVHQDAQGYIWLATNEGLHRYDGYAFSAFTSPNQTSLAGSCIKEDDEGRIWYENFDGNLHYVDKNRNTLQCFPTDENIGFIPYGITQNYLFVPVKEGIDVYDIHTLKKIKTIDLPTVDHQHTAHTSNRFYYIDQNTIYGIRDDFTQLEASVAFLGEETVKLVYAINDHRLGVMTKYNEHKQLYVFSEDLQLVDTIPMQHGGFIQDFTVIDQQYWLNTTTGTFVYNQEGVLMHHYYPNKSISGVIKDRQHNYWMSTTNGGIMIIPKLANQLYSLGNIVPNRIAAKGEGHYLIATKSGELIQTNKNFSVQQLLHTTSSGSEIYFLQIDSTTLTISFSEAGFYQTRFKSKTVQQFKYSFKDMCRLDNKYHAFAASSLSGLMLDTEADTNQFSIWDNCFKKYCGTDKLFARVFRNIRSKSVVYDSINKHIYYATNKGIFLVTPSSIQEITPNGDSFYASKLMLYGNRLFVLSTKGDLFEILDESLIPLNNTLGIAEYGVKQAEIFKDRIVLVGQKFIYQYSVSSGVVQTYDINISPYEINDILLEEDILLLLTNQGILSTHLNGQSKSAVPPLFYFEVISGWDKHIFPGIVAELDPSDNYIRIDYAILDFGKVTNIPFYYRINGQDWVLTSDKSRSIAFPSLSSGHYLIEFMLGQTVLPEKIEFVVLAPIWKRGWFILVITMLIVALGMVYYRYQVKLLFNQIKLLREKVQLEKNLSKSVLTSIKSQMNPHFYYNALNTIQAYIFTNDPDNASKYLNKFSKLTRRILELSEQDFITLSEEIDTLKLYLELEEVRFDGDFIYSFEIDESVDIEIVRVPSMLIQPYVENAIKHGLLHKTGDKKLTIRCVIRAEVLYIEIEDNGIGRKRSSELNVIKHEKHKSFALEANAKRLEVLNQNQTKKVGVEILDKLDEVNQPAGTTVIITIPMI